MANGLGAWAANFWQDMVIQWQIFVPVQCFNFTINAPHWRIPFLATAGFIYVMCLSFLHGDVDEVLVDEMARPKSAKKHES